MSFAQQRLWFFDQLEPGGALYNMPGALRIEGPLDRALLAHRLGEIVRRHEALRTVFAAPEGVPIQVIQPPAPFALPLVDLSGLPESAREAQALVLLAAEAVRPFDLARGPLLRGGLLRLAGEEHVLALTVHHIVSDGWSMGILIRELAARPSSLPELPVQYADFAVWQRSWLQGEVLEREIAFWRAQLDGLPPLLDLPADRPRPAAQSFRGASRPVRWPAGLARRAEALARREGATLFMVLLAAFQTLLARYSGQDDLAVGSPVAGRNREEIEGLIGFFVNTLVLRGGLTGNLPGGRAGAPSFRELLGRVRETALAAYMHQDMPFEKLVEELAPERSLTHSPLFQVMFVLQNAPAANLEIQGLRLRPVSGAGTTAKFDLTLSLESREGGLGGVIEYATDLFDGTTIDRLLGHFELLLAGAVSDPDRLPADLPLLSRAELHQMQSEWNPAGAGLDVSLVERFESWVDRTPEAVAVLAPEEVLTYAELDRRANRLARRLRALGVEIDSRVGLCAERSPAMVVAVLGILKAGAAYVPLDPAYPRERLAFMVEDARLSVLLAEERLLGVLPEITAAVLLLDAESPGEAACLPRRLQGVAAPDSLAYVIYTSGSTGRPKGVMIPHRGWGNLADVQRRFFSLGPGDRVLQFASLSFDGSAWEIAMAFGAGATLVLGPRERRLSQEELAALLRTSTIAALPPTVLATLEPGDLPDLKTLIVAGEACHPGLARRWSAGRRLFNSYGPTETSVCATMQLYAPREGGERLPIGPPIARMQAHVLDARGNPVPLGVAGELCVGGAGLARGYLDRPDRTAASFVPHPFATSPGERLYRTGDLVRWLPDGALDFLGRTDHQVKVRGFRIEPGEIEAALAALPGVREAVVVAREDVPGDRRLVAYVTGEATAGELRGLLRERLPDSMVPSAFVTLPALPLTPNGKVDRKALAAGAAPELASARESYVAPRTREEELLAAVWAQVLRLPRVGVDDNFFELGGDSILSVQIVARSRQAGLRFTVRQIFEHQTVAALARHVTLAEPAGDAVAGQGPVAGEVPLTPIQRWFFDQGFVEPHHFNQALLLEPREALDPAALERAMAAVVEHHDALRMRFDGRTQENASAEPVTPFYKVDLSGLPASRREAAYGRAAEALQAGFDLSAGPLTRLCLFEPGTGQRLLWVTHHLVVDGVSWRVLLADFEAAYRGAALPPKTASFQEWARRLAEYAETPAGELEYWRETARVPVPRLPVDFPEAGSLAGDEAIVSFELSAEETADLLQTLPAVFHTRIDEALLSALARAVAGWTGSPRLRVDLEGHGREPREPLSGDVDDLDVSRTVGWFTSLYPVVLEAGDAGPGEALGSAKERLRAMPGRGIGYGLLRHRIPPEAPAAEMCFNYLGQVDAVAEELAVFRVSTASAGPAQSPRAHRAYLLEISGIVAEGRLRIDLRYGARTHRRETVERLAAAYAGALRELIQHSRDSEEVFTPSDFPKAGLDAHSLEKLAALLALKNVEDLYPLTPLQNGMLFHSLMAPDSGVYVTQVTCTLPVDLDTRRFRQAWERLVERHGVLRTAFFWDGLDEPLQAVRRKVSLPWQELDWRDLSAEEQQRRLEELRHRERHTPLPLDEAPLMWFSLIRLGREHAFLWTAHHLLMDGWSLPLLVQELQSVYTAPASALPPVRPFSDYVVWLRKQDLLRAEPFWRGELAGFTAPNALGIDRRTQEGAGSAEHELRISREVTARLQAFASRHKLTLPTVTLGAWAVLLSRYSGEEDVVFGNVVSGRPAGLPGVETMVGMFVNTLPVRVRVSGAELLGPWLQHLQERQLARQDFEHSPLAQIQRWSEIPAGSPLFETLHVFESYPNAGDGGSGSLRIGDLRLFESTHYPVTLTLTAADQISLRLTSDRARVEEDAAPRLLRHLAMLLTGMAEEPRRRIGELSLLTAAEALHLRAWNETAAAYPLDRPLHAWIEDQAGRSPE
ncbi:MAG TPA: amino acid adenylation domain-containing protein, partial [Thermoanaerobaculia bacterium]|nr:amino acid adenylation domain-containing protein [Thermoanaerobaculia bacterium]